MLQIALLGPLEVTRDGRAVAVPRGKSSELLVRLALEPGVPVSADRLVEDLWAAGAASTQRNTLHAKVARLRRAIGDESLVSDRGGSYALTVESADVDALVVLDAATTARRLVDESDDRGAEEVCSAALALYRGEVLQAAGGGDWAEAFRARLDEARTTLLETWFTARLRMGAGADLIGDLEAAVLEHPFQEGLWELLITALYRAGRQADALAAYQRVRASLADELGLDPRPQLRSLERQVLNQAETLTTGQNSAAELDIDRSAGNLPALAVELVGREDFVATATGLLARHRLVEVVGPGGVGKTAVALAVGRGLAGSTDLAADGVWLVRLESAVTPDDVIDMVTSAMRVTGGEAALLERVRRAAAVIILDNCEHVLDAAADVAVRLIEAGDDVRVLCTSQVALDIDGEAVVELPPLELSDAVDLFNLRARAQRLNRRPFTADDAVHDLCRELDGLPLAIELAAARTKTLPPREIIRRLDDRLRVLSDPASRRPERRRSLRSTIDWSYRLLFPDDQRGLWALATFAGGAPMSAVEAVLGALDVPRGTAIDVVGRLVGRSLVMVDDQLAVGVDQPDIVRCRLLDSIRAFALEAMAEAGMADAALSAHASWFAEAADASTDGVRSTAQARFLAFARSERANVDAALAWACAHDPLLALRLVNGFGWAWVVLGDDRGAQRILAALRAVGADAGPTDKATALLLAGWIEASSGHLDQARAHVLAASELADAANDAELRARCLYYLAYVVSHHGDFQQALELTDRSRASYDELDRPWDQVANGLFAARAAISGGDVARSVAAADHVQQWLPRVDDPWLHVRAEAIRGELARVEGRFDDAVLHLGRAAATSRALGFAQTEAYQVTSLGRAECQAGDYDAGSVTLATAIDKAQAVGDLRLAALARVHAGRVWRALGQVERARSALKAASVWHQSAGGGEQAALGECLLSALDAADDVPGAEDRLREIVAEAQHDDLAHVEVFALDALGRLATVRGDSAGARELGARADDRMRATKHFITERDRTDAVVARALLAAAAETSAGR